MSLGKYNLFFFKQYFNLDPTRNKGAVDSFSDNHLLNNLVDYVSAPNILDMFDFFEDGKSVTFPVNQYYSVNEVLTLVSNPRLTNFTLLDVNELFPLTAGLDLVSLADTYSTTTQPLITYINCVTPKYNDIDFLTFILPEKAQQLENFELSGLEFEEPTYEILSTPDSKIFYPEPFVASPSFVHEDLWFIHILHFQHWLWFFFISLIMFFFITFVNVVRWCNLRTRPRRETRGVSRSKCADLITACVPVSWATAIIITETVDAADYYDGFGTGEIVVGIRAYQWGWEYFFPKNIDLNYNVSPSYSAFVGNSLKYDSASSQQLKTNSLWKFYQNKNNTQMALTPAHILTSPSNNLTLPSTTSNAALGVDNLKDANAFKKIQVFSKTNQHKLFSSKSEFETSFNKIKQLYDTDLDLNTKTSYGTLRQHSYNTILSTTTTPNLVLDAVSAAECGKSSPNTNNSFGVTNAGDQLTKYSALPQTLQAAFLKTKTLNQVLSVLSNTSDQKFFKNPLKNLFNLNSEKQQHNQQLLATQNVLTGGDTFLYKTSKNQNLTNLGIRQNENLFTDLNSPNLFFLGPDRSPRLTQNVNNVSHSRNFSNQNNKLLDVLTFSEKNTPNLKLNLYNTSKLNWLDFSKESKLFLNNVTFSNTHLPIASSQNNFNNTAHDVVPISSPESTPAMLRGKDETSPNYLFASYWSTYWAYTDPLHRLNLAYQNFKKLESPYLPLFTEYAEYDFRNWQALESLEDFVWESTYPPFLHEEYLNTRWLSPRFTKQEMLFNSSTRSVWNNQIKSGLVGKNTPDLTKHLTTLSLFSEENFLPTQYLASKNFQSVPIEVLGDQFDDSYELNKNLNHIYFLSSKNLTSVNTPFVVPASYATVLDAFRPDYEENFLYNDLSQKSISPLLMDTEKANTSLASSTVRSSNPLKLRSTAKNSIVTYNAIQKVFRSRFDEMRSHARLSDFANSTVKHPFLTDAKVSYESILGKNRESFFTPNFYTNYSTKSYSLVSALSQTTNTFYADIPFLLSLTSDPSRYLWFDWQSRWSPTEIAASSVSRYSLLGLPYPTKNFEYTTAWGDELVESETYLIKLLHARKNYLTGWAFNPLFFNKITSWYSSDATPNPVNAAGNITNVRYLTFSHKNTFLELNNNSFVKHSDYSPSQATINTPARASWQPIMSGVPNLLYNELVFADILSKREYLYRAYYARSGFRLDLPKYLLASPNNPLLVEIQKSYPVNDIVSRSAEANHSPFHTPLTKNLVNVITGLPLNTKNFENLIELFFKQKTINTTNNIDFYKNQYRPMRKGVTNMIKLHATGAVAMPIEIRLHILASSKDVIHSWAIPSAGIKIDCVPGYSSHRVTIFLVSGVYWGQCMEICGRFHHWMPIIIYFMKRDLFFLWCSHFMHFSTTDNTFNMSDRQLTNFVNLASLDSTNWAYEINNL